MCRATQANLDAVLQAKPLGGKPEWNFSTFITPDMWDELGGKPGFAEGAKKVLTLIAAGGRPIPIDPLCSDCHELKYIHKGDRLIITPIPCLCDKLLASNVDPAAVLARTKMSKPSTTKEPQKSTSRKRGFGELDRTGLAILGTYNRKMAFIEAQFEGKTAKEIIAGLLGSDGSTPPVTGEQGGKTLACFLFSEIEEGHTFLSNGIIPWLDKQLIKFENHPAQKLCIEEATKFASVLEEGLAKSQVPPAPDFD